MNNLQIFNSKEFGEIRTVQLNNSVYFVGKDVATALGYERATKAIQDHVDEEDKDAVPIQDSMGRMQNTPVITESGLYALIFGSKLESAKRFKYWVTSEVLPSIRKTGGYIAGQETLSDEELLEKAVLVAQRKIAERDKIIERQRQQIEQDKPKTIFADAVTSSSTSILIGDLAKLLRQNGVQIGQKRLFEWMRENGYLVKRKGSDWNMPTQKSIEQGLFEIKESTHVNGNGCSVITRTPKVTGKAQIYFINKFLREVKNYEST